METKLKRWWSHGLWRRLASRLDTLKDNSRRCFEMTELDYVVEYCNRRDEYILSDYELKLHSPRTIHFLFSSFYEYYNRYIMALNHDIQMLRRHVRSLHAWSEVEQSHLDDLDGDVWGCVLADYIEPTIRSAIDLPIEIKEKVYQGTWKLSLIADKGDVGVIQINDLEKKGNNKYSLLQSYGVSSHELDYLRMCLDTLHGREHVEAYELERLHGEKHHDILSPVHTEYPHSRVEKDGLSGMIIVHHTYDRLNLPSLIKNVDHQRILAQNTYEAFHSYAEMLIGRGLQP